MQLVIHCSIVLILAMAAGVQLNDPDPLFWIMLYLLAAVAPLLYLFKIKLLYRQIAYAVTVIFCVASIVMSVHGGLEFLQHRNEISLIHGMSPDKPYVEEARELIGTIVALVTVAAYWILSLKQKA
jgi:hypothetical protein